MGGRGYFAIRLGISGSAAFRRLRPVAFVQLRMRRALPRRSLTLAMTSAESVDGPHVIVVVISSSYEPSAALSRKRLKIF